jgi:hypothetical protein
MMNTLKVMSVGMGLAALAGCSTYKIQSWSDPAISERPIGTVMVVGIAQSATTCRMFENHFVEQLQIQGIAAVSGHALIQPTDRITEEQIDEALAAGAFDSILITRLAGEQSQSQYVQTGYQSAFPSYYGHYHGYYASSAISPVGYVDTVTEYLLETNLFDVESGKMVWGGIKSVNDANSKTSNIKKVATTVIKDLRRKKLLL